MRTRPIKFCIVSLLLSFCGDKIIKEQNLFQIKDPGDFSFFLASRKTRLMSNVLLFEFYKLWVLIRQRIDTEFQPRNLDGRISNSALINRIINKTLLEAHHRVIYFESHLTSRALSNKRNCRIYYFGTTYKLRILPHWSKFKINVIYYPSTWNIFTFPFSSIFIKVLFPRLHQYFNIIDSDHFLSCRIHLFFVISLFIVIFFSSLASISLYFFSISVYRTLISPCNSPHNKFPRHRHQSLTYQFKLITMHY